MILSLIGSLISFHWLMLETLWHLRHSHQHAGYLSITLLHHSFCSCQTQVKKTSSWGYICTLKTILNERVCHNNQFNWYKYLCHNSVRCDAHHHKQKVLYKAILMGRNAFCLIELMMTQSWLQSASNPCSNENVEWQSCEKSSGLEVVHQKFCDVSDNCCTVALMVSDHWLCIFVKNLRVYCAKPNSHELTKGYHKNCVLLISQMQNSIIIYLQWSALWVSI